MLALRQTNAKSRRVALRVFNNFVNLVRECSLEKSFIEILCVGLLSDKSTVKLSTLEGLAISYEMMKETLESEFLGEIIDLVLFLLKEAN